MSYGSVGGTFTIPFPGQTPSKIQLHAVELKRQGALRMQEELAHACVLKFPSPRKRA